MWQVFLCFILLPTIAFLFNLGTVLLLLLSVTFLAILYFYLDNIRYKLPPGPNRILSLLNFVYQIFTNKESKIEHFCKLHEKYGPILTIQLGSKPMIFISDYEMIKEMTSHPDLQLRPKNGIVEQVSGGLGLLSAEGNIMKHQRRFVLNSLRSSGMGKDIMEEKIHIELENVLQALNESNGNPMNVRNLLKKSTGNVFFNLAFNKKYKYDDQDFIKLLEAMERYTKLISTVGLVTLFKWLKPVFGYFLGNVLSTVDLMKAQSRQLINEHKETIDYDNPRDLLDNYLIEMKKKEESENDPYLETFTDEQLIFLLFDLFLGGTETSSTTIRWAILFMILNPDIQSKVHAEIDEVLGSEKEVEMKDKLSLPYTTATLQEVERLGSTVSFGVPRSCNKVIKFRGYDIPARSAINSSLYTIHRDSKFWENPEEFNPDRFITKDGNVFRPNYLLPFGAGKRSCPGESLAKMEIYIYFVTLMKHFRFENPKGMPLPTRKAELNALHSPKDYEVCCISRQK